MVFEDSTTSKCRDVKTAFVLGKARLLLNKCSLISPALEQFQSEGVFGVDDPHKQEAILLKLLYGEVEDMMICELAVP